MSTAREAFVRSVLITAPSDGTKEDYPFSVPAIRATSEIPLHPSLTFIVGESGVGKSTLLEAIAVSAGMNAEGGSGNFRFSTRATESNLHRHMRLVRGSARPRNRFFLRGESLYNVASAIESYGVQHVYGSVSLHEMSHGESVISLVSNLARSPSLIVMDEPEAGLSTSGQLALLRAIAVAAAGGSQLIVGTHSPVVVAHPNCKIYEMDAAGLHESAFAQLTNVELLRQFLKQPDSFMKHLLKTDDA